MFVSRSRVLGALLVGALLCGLSVVQAASAADGAEERRVVVRVFYDDPRQAWDLADFDLWEFNDTEERYFLVAATAAELERLGELGFRTSVDGERTLELQRRPAPTPQQTQGIPGYPCYRTVEESIAAAEQIVADHPELATYLDIGDSWERVNGVGEGWNLAVLRLTNEAVPGPKPKLIVSCSIHAREYTPAELCLRFAENLVAGYGSNMDTTWILDQHEIHLLLHANPDGRKKAETGLSWRKNTNTAYCSPTSNSRGADLNRNFEFQWGCCSGSSSNPCSSTYRGVAPASEPEVQALQAYLAAEFEDRRDDPLGAAAPADTMGIYLDIHSFSELVLWPWGAGAASANEAQLRTLGRRLAWFNDYEPKRAVELYPTDGTTIDYGYGELGVASFVFELGTSFFQDCATFEQSILPENLAALRYAARVARAPYRLPAGPVALSVTAGPSPIVAGATLYVTMKADDAPFNHSHGTEPVQAIAAVEAYVDVPPWEPGASPATSLFPVDGTFDTPLERCTGTLDTAGLAPGEHTIWVRARDAAGDWGPVGAARIEVEPAPDGDGDGTVDAADCAPGDATVWAAPTAAQALRVEHGPSQDELSWSPPEAPGAAQVLYDVLRSASVDGFEAASCVASDLTQTMASDAGEPAAGAIDYLLIRARNACGESLGAGSDGQPRPDGPASCP